MGGGCSPHRGRLNGNAHTGWPGCRAWRGGPMPACKSGDRVVEPVPRGGDHLATTRCRRSVLAITLAIAGCLATAIGGAAPAWATDPVLGNYNVTYGNQAIVQVKGSSSGYSIIAKSPVYLGSGGIPATTSCYL